MIRINLNYLAKTYGIKELLAAYVIWDEETDTSTLVLEGEQDGS